jgi:hypothetical protein
MIYLFLSLAVGLFVVALKASGLVPRAQVVFSATRAATAVMRSPELSEEQKETAVQKAALEMFGSLFSIAVRTVFTLALPVALVLLGCAVGLYSAEEAVRAASNWYFIVLSTVITAVAFVVIK